MKNMHTLFKALVKNKFINQYINPILQDHGTSYGMKTMYVRLLTITEILILA